jgi:hypothetical protein
MLAIFVYFLHVMSNLSNDFQTFNLYEQLRCEALIFKYMYIICIFQRNFSLPTVAYFRKKPATLLNTY